MEETKDGKKMKKKKRKTYGDRKGPTSRGGGLVQLRGREESWKGRVCVRIERMTFGGVEKTRGSLRNRYWSVTAW